MTDPIKLNICIITDIMPGNASVGAIYLKDAFAKYDNIHYILVNKYNEDVQGNMIAINTPKPRRKIDKISLGMYDVIANSHLVSQRNVYRIKQYCRNNKIEVIVLILFNNWIIRNAKYIIQQLNIPLVTIVWDPPDYLCYFRKLGKISRYITHLAYNNALVKSSAIGYPSYNMAMSNNDKYNKYYKILIHSVDKNLFNTYQCNKDREYYDIVFSGSMYAKDNWDTLLKALDNLKWKLDERKVRILWMGRYAVFPIFTTEKNIVIKGFVSIEKQIKYMSSAELCYLPYWFDKNHRESIMYSYPNKASIYIASGCPILFHGPQESSFLNDKRHGRLGPICTNNSVEDLQNVIHKYSSSTKKQYIENIEYARNNIYNLERYRCNINEMIMYAYDKNK